MKTNRTLIAVSTAAATLTALVCAHPSFAGKRVGGTQYDVQVSTTYSLAVGSLAVARAATDSNEYIGCTLGGYSQAAANTVICEANTSTNVYKSCSVTAPWAAAAVAALNDNSVLQFNWDSTGTCTEVEVRNDSAYPVVVP